jgi:hypothetical protein
MRATSHAYGIVAGDENGLVAFTTNMTSAFRSPVPLLEIPWACRDHVRASTAPRRHDPIPLSPALQISPLCAMAEVLGESRVGVGRSFADWRSLHVGAAQA